MARKSVIERIEAHKSNKLTSGSNTTGGVAMVSKGNNVVERIENHKLKRNVGIDTFGSDLSTVNAELAKVTGGWQTQETMANFKSSVEDMYKRTNAFQDYTSKYMPDAKANVAELTNYYKNVLDNWDSLANTYGMYQDADSYTKETSKLRELYSMSKDELESYLKSDNPIAYTTYGGQDITWKSLYDEKVHAEMAKSKEGAKGWEKYLADESKEQEAKNKSSWMDTVLEGFAYSSDTTMPNANLAQIVNEKRKDTSYMKPTKEWTEEEQKIFGAYYMDSPEKAYEYATNLNNQKNVAKEDAQKKKITDSATSGFLAGAGHTLGSIASAPLGLADYLDDLTSNVAGRPITSDGFVSPFEYSQTVQGGISTHLNDRYGTLDEDIPVLGGKGLGDAYGLGTSIAQSAVSGYTLGGLGTMVSYFGQGASASVDDALSRGATDEQALLYGTIVGLGEGISEKIGVDNLFKLGSANTLKGMMKNVLKQAGAEGIEEGISSVIEQVADNFVMQDNSAFNNAIRTYMANGMSKEEATKKAWADSFNSVAFDTVAGAVSGGVHAGVQTPVQTFMENKSAGKAVRENQRQEELKNLANDLGGDAYLKYAEMLDSGKMSDAKLGKFYNEVQSDVQSRYNTEVDSMVRESIVKMANELGDSKNSGLIASAVQKNLSGQKLTEAEKAVLKTETAQGVLENIKKGGLDTRKGGLNVNPSSSFDKALDNIERTNTVMTSKTEEEQTIQKAEEQAKQTVKETFADGVQSGDVTAYAKTMSDEKAEVFLAQYDGKTDLESYANSFELAYTYGEAKIDINKALSNKGVLTEAQALKAYEAGNRGRVIARQKAVDAINKKYSSKIVTKGQFNDSIIDYNSTTTDGSKVNWNSLTAKQKNAISFVQAFSQATGVNIQLIRSKVENGKHKGENGRYEHSTNTIYIDVYAGRMDAGSLNDAIIPTVSHEVTHWMKAKSPAMYQKMQELILDTLAQDGRISVNDLIAKQKADMKKKHPDAKVTDESAIDELVARGSEDMLANSDSVRKMLAKMSKSEQDSFVAKVKETFKNIMDWVNDLLKQYRSDSDEAKILREYKARMKELSKMWDEALAEAVKTNQSLQQEGVTGEQASEENQFSIREISPITEEEYDTLKEFFGTTKNFNVAGYMLKDGVMLDFSGRHWGNPSADSRDVDHRDVWDAWEHDDRDGTEEMVNMIGNGNIRLMPESGGINLAVKPTEQQVETLKKYINHFKGEVIVDFDQVGGDTVDSYTYNKGTSGDRVIDEINTYFRGGRRSELAQFLQYSDRDSDGNTLTTEQQEFFKDSKVRDENGNLLVVYHGSKSNGFNIFEYSPIRQTGTDFGEAYYFTSDFEKANGYSYDSTKDSRVQEYKKERKRLLDKFLETKEEADRQAFLNVKVDGKTLDELLNDEAYSTGGEVKKVYLNLTNPLTVDADGKYYYEVYESYFEEAREKGNDGIIVKNVIDNPRGEHRPIDVYIAFKNNQMKSIDNVNPTPDSDIRYSDRIDSQEQVATYNLEGKWNDYIAVQKEVVGVLKGEGFFEQGIVTNTESGMEIRINAKGIKETLGSGNRFQTLPKKLKIFKIATIRSLPKLIETGYVIEDDVENTHDKEGFRYAYIGNETMIDGEKVGVRISIKKKVGSNHFWIHNIDDIVGNEKNSELLSPSQKTVLKETQSSTDKVTQEDEEVNINFSDRDNVSVYDLMGETERLQKQNAELQADIERLKERLRLEKKLTQGNTFDEKKLENVARYLLRSSNSNYSMDMLVDGLRDVYSYIVENRQIDWNDLYAKAYDVARNVLAEQREQKVENEYYKMILDDIRKTKIKLSEQQIAEAKYTFGNNYHKMFFGRITLTDKGIDLDSKWQEWSSMYPEIFDAETSPADQITALYDIYDSVRDSAIAYQRYNDEEDIRALATEIYNQYWNVSTIRTTADKYDAEVKRLNYEHRNTMKRIRDGYRENLEKQALADRIHYGKIINDVRNRKEAEIKRAKELGKKRVDAIRERAEVNAKVQKITKNALTLNDWLVKNNKDKHIPEPMKEAVVQLVGAIDFSSKQMLGDGQNPYQPTKKDMRLSKALSKLQEVAKEMKLQEAEAKAGESIYMELDLPDSVVDTLVDLQKIVDGLADRFGGERYVINQMSLEELSQLDDVISTLKTSIATANKTFVIGQNEARSSIANQLISNLNILSEKKMDNVATNFLEFQNTTPYYMLKRLGPVGERIFNALMDAQENLVFLEDEIVQYVASIVDGKKIQEWSKEVHEFEVLDTRRSSEENPKYKKIKMTTAQIMSIHALNKRESAKLHLEGGGIRVADIELSPLNKIMDAEGASLAPSELTTILNSLTDEQKQVADALQKFMSEKGAEWGNKVTMARWGIAQFGEENYFPMDTVAQDGNLDSVGQKDNSIYRLLNMSFTKSLTPNANNQLVIDNIFDVFARHMTDMAKYTTHALPLLDTMKILGYSYKQYLDEEKIRHNTISVAQSVRRVFGKGGYSYIINLLKDLNGAEVTPRDETIPKKLMANYKISAVGGNLRVAMLQGTAFIKAGLVLEPKYLSKALVTNGIEGSKKAMKHSGIALWKSKGHYDLNISKSVAQEIKQDASAVEKIREASLKGAEWGDKLTWGYLWNACELWAKDNTNYKYGSEEFNKAVADKLREVIVKTQVVDSTLTRSQMMRSKSAMVQTLTAFMSESTMTYNMLSDAFFEWSLDARKEGNSYKNTFSRHGRKFATTIGVYTLTAFTTALAGALIDAVRDDDEEKEFDEKYLEAFLESLGDNLNVFSSLPIIKDIVSIAQGYSPSRFDEQSFVNIFSGIRKWVKVAEGEGNVYSATYKTLQGLSQLSGLPASNMLRDTVAMWNATIGEMYPSLRIKQD